MTTYDFERPFISASSLPLWESHDPKVSAQFGRTVRATPLSNVEYKLRFDRLSNSSTMKPPPGTGASLTAT